MASHAKLSLPNRGSGIVVKSHTNVKQLISRTNLRSCVRAAQDISTPNDEKLKRAVAKKALELVKSGMTVSFGNGSTSSLAMQELGLLLKAGKVKDVVAVETSFQSHIIARQNGIRLLDLNDVSGIDLAIFSADEVDPNKNIIKGGGGAHLMGKVINTMAKESIVIVDDTKFVKKLGSSFPVPVEVVPQAITPVLRSLASITGGFPEIRSALRKDGPVMTDHGNMLVDVTFPTGIDNPEAMERDINNIPGVIENGICTGIIQKVLIASMDGEEPLVVELADFLKSFAELKSTS